MAEWLRRWTANPMGSARVGSNPILVDNFFQGNILIFVRLHPNTGKHHMPPWRNRLARSAVNRKVGGSSPPGGAYFFMQYNMLKVEDKKFFDPGRTRTCNPLIRSQMPYPLGHRAR